MTHPKAGYLYALLASLFFASIAVLGKFVISDGVSSIELMFWQYVFTIILLSLYLGIKQPQSLKVNKSELKRLVIQGLLGSAGTNLFFYLALNSLSAGMTSMLLFTNPIFITLYMWASGKKKIGKANWMAILMAFVGGWLVLNLFSTSGNISLTGVALGLMSGICYAFYNVYADLKLSDLDPNVINLYGCLTAITLPATILLTNGEGIHFAGAEQMAVIFALALVAGIMPIFLIYKAIRSIGSEKASVIATMELPMTILMASIFLKETMNGLQLLGIVLISGAGLLLHQTDKSVKETA